MLYKHRNKFASLQKKIGFLFARLPLKPNHYTLLAPLLALLAIPLILTNNFILAVIFYALSFFLDIIDGAVARATNQVTKLGAFYDTVSDKYTEFFFIAGFAFIQAPAFFLTKDIWLILYAGSFLLSGYIKAASVEKNAIQKEMKGGGLLERPERVLLLLLVFILNPFYPLYSTILIALMTLLAHITAFQRFRIIQKSHN